jgi:hypothetical protein
MKCTFCGENEAKHKIPSPNMNDEIWEVCDSCNQAIPQMQKLSLGHFLKDYNKRKGIDSKIPDKIIKEAETELRKPNKEAGK